MIRVLIIMVFTAIVLFQAVGDVLLWSVDENTTVDGIDIQTFLVPYPSTDDSWPAARVKLVSSDGSSSTILKIYSVDEDGNFGWQDGDWGAEIADWADGYGARGNQSETGYNTIQTIQQQFNGETPTYPPEVMDALMVMELGYNEWNDAVGDGDYVWRTIASSTPELYKDLVGKYMYASGDVAPPSTKNWNPDFYTMNPPVIPEPSTGLLFAIGAGLLVLRRKYA